MSVLSIQSRVIQGHVGNAAAVLPLQYLGHEVWAVDTVTFSNHPGRSKFRGRVTPPAEVADLLLGLEEQEIFTRCQAVISGYLGDAGNTTAIAASVAAVKRANPDALYLLDPVMGDHDVGDHGALYVRPTVPPAIRQDLLPIADIATPNQFELEYLTGGPLADTAAAIAAARSLGPARVFVTSLKTPATEAGILETLMVDANGAWLVRQPAFERRFDGSGDMFAALFLGHFLNSKDAVDAFGRACAGVALLLRQTMASGQLDIPLTSGIPSAVKESPAEVLKLS
ncbi:pyridoxal kinase [Lacibacterium aquatile]|uniref:pyridoxal kinase n=1 Tax=Lacibacterium aquatile TaxID=1168082 RepID=A0ABW5DMG4_9PROT